MRGASTLAGLLALAAGPAAAFSDTFPFLLFSTSDLPHIQASSQLQPAARVLAEAQTLLAGCPTSRYLLVSQPGAHAADLYAPPACEAHRLRRAATSSAVRGRFSVAEVLPEASAASAASAANLTLDALARHVRTACAARGVADVAIQQLALPPLPAAPRCADRAEAMGDNDYVLGNLLDDELAQGDYTVVYLAGTGAAAHDDTYAPAFDEPAQAPIRRAVHVPRQQQQQQPAEAMAAAAPDTRGLFEKYQFFTPGVFMSLSVLLLLLTILYAGVSAVASLQVPYGAFDKEMGPAAQKKQQ